MKMKLTKFDREAFVNALMDDVPSIDYNEQARSICMKWAIARMPPEVAAVHKKHPGWIENRYLRTPGHLSSMYVPMPELSQHTESEHPELWAELAALSELASDQIKQRKNIEIKAMSSIACCSTLKQALERLPEFEKYLPFDRTSTGTVNLPAVANLVADLMVAGWPKGKALEAA